MGVHKRLACSEMVACQLSQRAPSCTEFIAKARKILAASDMQRKLVFLATDDAQARKRCVPWLASALMRVGLNYCSQMEGLFFGAFFFGAFFFVLWRPFVLAQERNKETSDAYVERKQDPKPQKECWGAKP